MRRATLAVAGLLLLPAGASAAPVSACEYADEAPTPTTLAPARRATLCLVNEVRAAEGLPPVHTREGLREAAGRHAENMRRGNFFSHVTPGGRTLRDRIRASGYLDEPGRFRLGEVLAWGTDARATPAWALGAWLESPPHRRVLLDPELEHAGIGVAFGSPFPAVQGTTAATFAVDLGARD